MSLPQKFLNYVSFDTQSDPASQSVPSTLKQLDLAQELEKECARLGVEELESRDGIIYFRLPGTAPQRDPIGFLAHMDTALEISGKDVHPRIIENYDGGTIRLNEEFQMSPEQFPSLNKVIGDDLIVTDGTTLLGADDKAGVAIIMETIERLKQSDLLYPDIYFAFTSDEEIGRGVDHFDSSQFPVAYAYTVDGADIQDVDYEMFNAASAVVKFQGVSIHPGDAKDKMINASQIAMEFHARLDPQAVPEKTSGREGFIHLVNMEGNVDHARLEYIIRDHDAAKFEAKKEEMLQAAKAINEKHPDCVHIELHDQYKNMLQYLLKDMRSVDRACAAMQKLGMEPVSTPIRGGTDGGMLSERGILTPNLGTGSFNHHGRYEFASIQKMEKMVELLTKIAELNL